MRKPVSAVSADTTLEVAYGDILREPADAVVIPTNSFVNGVTGALNQAMRRAAGPALEDETDKIDYCHRGQAVITAGGNLPARRVIHTPGPIWRGGADNEDYYLASSYVRSLQLADREGLTSVAFAAISHGGRYFPVDRASRIALQAVAAEAQLTTSVKKVRFVFVNEDWLDVYADALTRMDEPNHAPLAVHERFMRVITAPLDTVRFAQMIAPDVELDKTKLKLAQPRRECDGDGSEGGGDYGNAIYDVIPLVSKDGAILAFDRRDEPITEFKKGFGREDGLVFPAMQGPNGLDGLGRVWLFEALLTQKLVHYAKTGPGGAPWLAQSEAAMRRAVVRAEREDPGPRLFALNRANGYGGPIGVWEYAIGIRSADHDFGWY